MFKKLLCSSLIFVGSLSVNSWAVDTNLKYLPNEADWLNHAKELEKFWVMPEAYGNPVGNFPTWRCNNGKLRNEQKCPEEFKAPDFLPYTKYNFVRMISRQTFGYGALFNLTGNPELLRLHKAGVNYLIKEAKDPQGGFYSIISKDGEKLPPQLERTSQDVAYALLGLSMNAYLTNDPEVLKIIEETYDYIYNTYYDPQKNLLKWVLEDSEFDKKEQVELVAQLDQLNAYLLLCWRLVPPKNQAKWTKTIQNTIKMINDNFYQKDKNIFLGCTHSESCKEVFTGRHLDYGHRIKTFWMEYLVSLGLGDEQLKEFAQKGMIETLDKALTLNKYEWFESDTSDEASWWVAAELDQASLTLALARVKKMPDTLFNWIENRVDHEYGELNDGLKTHPWRNAYHSTEHALIGYITTQGIRAQYCKRSTGCLKDNQVDLYFAPKDISKNLILTPYIFSGSIKNMKINNKEDGIYKVTFEKIGLPQKINKVESYKFEEKAKK
ncbi:MAG: AGE family epimerase/isomerase [Ruminobacter sp.]|nr:AGE family epimerase/isomerase [Ruminobacter sp.]MDY5779395.1 AGE family epimerase/isomerase [Succinivibrionaceae bacterium]